MREDEDELDPDEVCVSVGVDDDEDVYEEDEVAVLELEAVAELDEVRVESDVPVAADVACVHTDRSRESVEAQHTHQAGRIATNRGRRG